MKKKITTIAIISILNVANAATTVDTNTTDINSTNPLVTTITLPNGALKTCIEVSELDYNPTGDTRGHSVLTQREVVRDCNTTKTVNGACIRWENITTVDSLPSEVYRGFDDRDYTDTIGSFFAAAGAYDQLDHLWSGFRGHCIIGTLQDFSWASDPMFWGSMAMDYLMSGGEAGSLSDSLNESMSSLGSTISPSAADIAQENSLAAINNATADSILNGGSTLTQISSDAIQEAAEAALNAGRCLTSSAINLGMTGANYFMDSAGDFDRYCNPIDEICEEQDFEESDIMTLDIVQFQDMVDSFNDEGEDIYQYITVVEDGASSGIVAYRYKTTNEVDNFGDMNSEEAEEMQEKMKEMSAIIGVVSSGLQMASCFTSYGSSSVGTTSSQTDDTRASVENAGYMAINFATRLIPPPAGPIIGAALKIIWAFGNSFQSVDSCYDEEDAEAQGSRHEKTQKALRFNLCRPLYDKCEDEWLWGGCCLTAYEYCCYDQLLTKVIVEQLKAELGRDWSNCTGISIRDLNYVSFEQCTDTQMENGLDGAHKYGLGWNPQESFQYIYKCMDLTEFKDYLKDVVGSDIDESVFDDYWSDLTEKSVI